MHVALPDDLTLAAPVVQQALTPVFLLSGIAALLNVFASRLAPRAGRRPGRRADRRRGHPR